MPLRLLAFTLLPVVIWASLGLWGLAARAALLDDSQPVPLTRALVFQAIACGPIAFFVNWRRSARRIARRARKYPQECEGAESEPS